MFKHAKVYPENIPPSHSPHWKKDHLDKYQNKSKYKFSELRDFIFNHYKEIPDSEIALALSLCTKNHRTRFKRYGRIPPPVKELFHRHKISTGIPWETK